LQAADSAGFVFMFIPRACNFVCYQVWILGVIRRFPNIHAGPSFDLRL
jgi:hypothetical protein